MGARLARRAAGAARELLVYVGTYTAGKSAGIYLYRLDLGDGSLRHAGTTEGVVNPSYLTIDRARRRLFAVNEVDDFEGAKSGAVSAFRIDPKSGALRLLDRRRSMGGSPCYVTAADSGRFVLVANYTGGSVAVLPVSEEGSLGKAVHVEQFRGSGPNRERQEAPHAHCVLLDRANDYAYACDLGTDRVMAYRFDRRTGRLTPNVQASVSLRPGAGPRHMALHPRGRAAYVLNELDATVTAFALDPRQGTLRELETVATLPSDFKGQNTSADVHVAPGGKFLYCSNRGHDSIAAFRIDTATGRLTPVGHTPTGGKTPRNFAIDPTGAFLLAANQNSDSVVTFRIDPQTGALGPTGHRAEIPTPVCLKLTTPF
ncbi:MAG TPA: lactonase family protein [Pyrinomonadaceae bacterium]|nr:lactonase family protein [Pyrinomonadaceae bacterium]